MGDEKHSIQGPPYYVMMGEVIGGTMPASITGPDKKFALASGDPEFLKKCVDALNGAVRRPTLKDSERPHDKNGVPIYPGDLLKTYHFTGRRRKKYFLYHTVVEEEGRLWIVPTPHLEPTKANGGGKCLINEYMDMSQIEVIHGHGPSPYIYFEDRPRMKEARDGE